MSAFQTISQLAAQRPVHRAFQWFHLQEPKLRDWHRQVAAIPAPFYGETARAQWLTKQFVALGLDGVEIDACGNTRGWVKGTTHTADDTNHPPCILCSAHLDTVFAADAIGQLTQDGNRLLAPGASDNCAGIVALLSIAAAMRAANVQPATDILFTGNVGEEGEGNLRGMRYLFSDSSVAGRIRAAVVLDGAGTESIVTQGLGSKRFRIAVTGPGGHSWTDAGTPNPILVLARALDQLAQIELAETPRTTWNVGSVEGGTAINAIPESAEIRIDTRSTHLEALRSVENTIRDAMEEAVSIANRGKKPRNAPTSDIVRFAMETIGERPAARLPDNATILALLHAVDRHLGIQSESRIASTDANIPLSLGIEAVSIGSGGSGGGIHTRQEWFDAQGRDLGLRRILLLLLALAQTDV
jgi:tripeptide aminopeptidase